MNEPETSLHPDLMPALARLIGKASRESQLMVVSHSTRLITALERVAEAQTLDFEKRLGETTWQWPAR